MNVNQLIKSSLLLGLASVCTITVAMEEKKEVVQQWTDKDDTLLFQSEDQLVPVVCQLYFGYKNYERYYLELDGEKKEYPSHSRMHLLAKKLSPTDPIRTQETKNKLTQTEQYKKFVELYKKANDLAIPTTVFKPSIFTTEQLVLESPQPAPIFNNRSEQETFIWQTSDFKADLNKIMALKSWWSSWIKHVWDRTDYQENDNFKLSQLLRPYDKTVSWCHLKGDELKKYAQGRETLIKKLKAQHNIP